MKYLKIARKPKKSKFCITRADDPRKTFCFGTRTKGMKKVERFKNHHHHYQKSLKGLGQGQIPSEHRTIQMS